MNNAQSIPSVTIPPPAPGICYLVGPSGGGFARDLSENLCPEGDTFVNSSRSGLYRSFFNISLENRPI